MKKAMLIAAAISSAAVMGLSAPATHALQIGGFSPIQFSTGVPNGEVVLNLTVENPQAAGFLTAYPCASGAPNPLTSNVNFRAGQTTSTAAIVKSDAAGNICVQSNTQTDIIVDQFDARPMTNSSGQNIGLGVHNGVRMVDTRNTGRLNAAGVFSYHAGAPGSTVLMNLTAVNPSAAGYLTAYPCDQSMPLASNVNFAAADVVPNFVQTLADRAGNVCIFSNTATDLVVDQFAESTNPFVITHNPVRMIDTRTTGNRLSQGSPLMIRVAPGLSTVSFNLTAVNPSTAGYLTAYGCDAANATVPQMSNVNFAAGETRANFAKVKTPGGLLCITSNTSVDVVVDQVAEDASTYPSPATTRVFDSRTIPTPAPPAPPAPAASFNPGTHLVNVEMAAGRYIADARNGCYWERLSGLGGTLNEIIANDFQDFNGSAIVDILPTDLAFHFDADCGNFKPYTPSATASSIIVPGAHVVGLDILPGTYMTSAQSGCYWERTTSFDGRLSSIIANDFLGSAGTAFVSIAASDVGFRADLDCGIWTRIGG